MISLKLAEQIHDRLIDDFGGSGGIRIWEHFLLLSHGPCKPLTPKSYILLQLKKQLAF